MSLRILYYNNFKKKFKKKKNSPYLQKLSFPSDNTLYLFIKFCSDG